MCLGNTLTDACTHPVLELLEKHCSSGVLFPSAYKGIISYFAGLQQKLPAQYKKRTLIEVLKQELKALLDPELYIITSLRNIWMIKS